MGVIVSIEAPSVFGHYFLTLGNAEHAPFGAMLMLSIRPKRQPKIKYHHASPTAHNLALHLGVLGKLFRDLVVERTLGVGGQVLVGTRVSISP